MEMAGEERSVLQESGQPRVGRCTVVQREHGAGVEENKRGPDSPLSRGHTCIVIQRERWMG